MRRLIGCMSVFNEQGMLGEPLATLCGICDHVVVVDGAHQLFPGEGLSIDGTRELVAEARRWGGATVELRDSVGETESEKRSRYFVGEPGDWYLILDADELLELYPPPGRRGSGPLRDFLETTQAHAVRLALFRPWDWLIGGCVRLIAHVPGMRYGPHHSQILAPVNAPRLPRFDGTGELGSYVSTNEHDRPRAIVANYHDALIVHRHHQRDERRKLEKGEWHRNMQEARP